MHRLIPYIEMLRPIHWIKNGFVFTGLIFSESYNNPALLVKSTLTFIAFCLVSSSVYIINDIIDRKKDLLHPNKKFRPIPAGKVSVEVAGAVSFVLFLLALAIGYQVSYDVTGILGFYSVLNIVYSIILKNIVILDAFIISTGFMLRILAGTVGIGIPPSKWLLLCGLMITLFLAFTKRRAEMIAISSGSKLQRSVLEEYSSDLLDNLITICASCVIISYSLYTMSTDTILLHRTENLIYTVPFVIYALFRYLYLLYIRKSGENPSQDLIQDRHIVIAILCWTALTIYFFKK